MSYDEKDAILYALAVGATPDQLDLVYEENLRVLPTFAMTLCQWAPDVLASAGAFDNRAVHGSQRLEVFKELPRAGELVLNARVGDVWDKGKAAIFEVIVESDYFAGTWSLFAPGYGGFGGERGPGRPEATQRGEGSHLSLQTFATQPALYRLTGDRHPIHIDPQAAERVGAPRPIMHGLCTLAAAVLPLAIDEGAHPADLTLLEGRFTGHVFPGDELAMRSWPGGDFEVARDGAVVISAGKVSFA